MWIISLSIIACIFAADIQSGICQQLIFSWCILCFQMITRCLSGNFSLDIAVICVGCNKYGSLFFADFRRLDAKRVFAFSRNPFSSFKRWILLSCSFARFLSSISSSLRDNVVVGVWIAPPALRRPSLKAFIQHLRDPI